MKSTKPLIIDTDIGSDIDDAIAVSYAIRSGMDIKLITTVHGDTAKRAMIARKLSILLGANIPVAAGEEKPIRQGHIYWYGDEGGGFIESENDNAIRKDGVDALI